MSFDQTFRLMQACGVTLFLYEGNLIASPKSAITPALRSGLKTHKQKFLCFLAMLKAADEQGFNGLIFFDAYEPESALHAGWFWTQVHTLPWEPFELNAGVRIEEPEQYYWSLKSEIEVCPKGVALTTLVSKLRLLFDRFSGYENDALLKTGALETPWKDNNPMEALEAC